MSEGVSPDLIFPVYLGHTGGMSQITIFPGLRADLLGETIPVRFHQTA
jgi:hypothetical protein